MKFINRFLVICLLALTTGCMTYRNIPPAEANLNNSLQKISGTLNYKIEGDSLFAGPMAVREVLAKEAPYALISATEEDSAKGDYLKVSIAQTPPSIPAVAFGYLSFATLTILPFWSSNDGSILTYSFYRNGEKVGSREYVISRGTFVWIVMLPLAWVNLMTPSENEAFEACTRDFIKQYLK